MLLAFSAVLPGLGPRTRLAGAVMC